MIEHLFDLVNPSGMLVRQISGPLVVPRDDPKIMPGSTKHIASIRRLLAT